MPTPLVFPLVNGCRHSFASIELRLGQQIFTGFKAINYSRKRTRVKVRGNHPDPLAKTRGSNEYAADCELYLAEWNLFQSSAAGGLISASISAGLGGISASVGLGGGGYGDQSFQVIVTYNENGFDTISDTLIGCSIDTTEASQSQSDDPLVRKVDLGPLKILFNGLDDVSVPLQSPGF